jgi:TRAP transporter 4TM/12TM fusion protein
MTDQTTETTPRGRFERDDEPPQPTEEHLLDEFEAERPGRNLEGFPARLVAVLSAGLSLFAIFWVFEPLAAQVYRPAFLTVALLLTFIVFGRRKQPSAGDWIVAVLAAAAVGYAVVTSGELVYRAARPELLDIVFGVAAIVFVLEATRRTTGWALPAICLAFLLYAFFGGLLPEWTQIAHKGYGIDRIVGQSYMGLDGIFGVPLDVAATYIVLFSIYGAVLEFSGAARFFVEISFAAFGRSRTGPGRTTAGAGFLLGTVSGSGVATTVTLGSVTWPLLRKAGYPKEQGGGIMAASGIGAILSPPTLGAAAFIIAEVLEVSYLQVLIYALVPSILYYVGIVMAIEADARRHQVKGLEIETPGVWKLLARWGYHFSSLFLIVILLVVGFSAFRAVIIATVVAFLLSFLDRRDWMGPKQVGEALVAGARGALPVVATCAAAGLIVAVVSLTGLGLKIAGLIVDLAGGSLTFTAILSAVAVLILGLAVPVTASFIIAAAVVAPALIALGVEDFAAYMFIFYYAVLSEVSPPTALSAFAASAITGGNGFKTMMLTCRYTLPAFLVPFAFILSPKGEGLLLQGGAETIAFAVVVSLIAVVALGLALEGWLKGEISVPARLVIGVAALLLLWLEPTITAIGLAVLAAGLVLHALTRKREPAAA